MDDGPLVLAKALFVSDIMSDMPRGCRKICKCSNSRRQLLPELTGLRKTSRATPRGPELDPYYDRFRHSGCARLRSGVLCLQAITTCEKAMMHEADDYRRGCSIGMVDKHSEI